MGTVRERSWINKDGTITTTIGIDYKDITGKRRKEQGFKTKKEAKARLNELEYHKDKGMNIQTARTLRFKDAAEQFVILYATTDCKPSTLSSYKSNIKNHINPYFGELRLVDIQPDTIQNFKLEKQKAGLSPKTINNNLNIISGIFEQAINNGLILRNPVRSVKKLKLPHREMEILTMFEINCLLEAAKHYYPDFYPLLLTALMCGFRRGELLGLSWDNIDLKNKAIYVTKALYKGEFQAPKTEGSVRKVYISNELVKVLEEWKKRCPKGDMNLVFPNSVGEPQDGDNMVKRRFKKCLAKAKIKKHIVFHSLRHQLASIFVSNNVPMKFLQAQLGHNSITTSIDRYSHLMDNVNKEAMDMLDNVFGKKMNSMRKPVFKD